MRYVCSTKETDSDLATIPDGMEFFEKASGQVFLRKHLETALHPDEIELIQRKCKTLANPHNVRFELGKDDITVHSSRFFDSRDLGFPLYISAQKAEEMLSKMAVYTPAFRFTLEDENSGRSLLNVCHSADMTNGIIWNRAYFLIC